MSSRRAKRHPSQAGFLGWLIPLTVVGLSVADFANDGQIDKFLIGALLIFGLGALGWRLDDIVSARVADQIQGSIGGGSDDPAEPPPDSQARNRRGNR